MWSKTNKKRNCELACLTPQTCLPSYLCIGWSCILKEKFPNMLLTVSQVERCQGDDDWSLCYKKFYGVPPCDVEWGSKWNEWQRAIASMLQNGQEYIERVDRRFSMPFRLQETMKMIPLVCTSLMMMYGWEIEDPGWTSLAWTDWIDEHEWTRTIGGAFLYDSMTGIIFTAIDYAGGFEPMFSSLYCNILQIDGNGSVDA